MNKNAHSATTIRKIETTMGWDGDKEEWGALVLGEEGGMG